MSLSKPRALLLTHRFPFPPDKGDKIRSWHLLKFLSERYEVALGTFLDDPADAQYKDIVEEVCVSTCILPLSKWQGRVRALKGILTGEPLTFAWHHDPRMTEFVTQERQKGPVVEIYFSGAMTTFAEGATVPVLTDLVDADSAKWASYAEEGTPWMRAIYAREARKVAAAEATATKISQKTFLISPEEAAVVDALPGVKSVSLDWYRNGIDLSVWRADGDYEPLPDPFDIIFTGAMDYRPNAEGAVWFAENVWPALRAHDPTLTFGIVGRNPTAAVKVLNETPGIFVTGRVEDVRPYVAGAKVAVAPLAIARGVQNKVLEAMAMGVPVVATTGAIAGTAAVPGQHLIEANDPADMVSALTAFLANPSKAQEIGSAGRVLIETHYPWEKVLERFARYLP